MDVRSAWRIVMDAFVDVGIDHLNEKNLIAGIKLQGNLL